VETFPATLSLAAYMKSGLLWLGLSSTARATLGSTTTMSGRRSGIGKRKIGPTRSAHAVRNSIEFGLVIAATVSSMLLGALGGRGGAAGRSTR